MPSQFISTYTSFSGADLVVTFANQVIGELQQITYAIQREKVPVFTLGSPNARSFSRGKRGIAGSLVLAQFDHDALMKAMKDVWSQIAPPAMFSAAGNLAMGKSEAFANALDLVKWNKTAADTLNKMVGEGQYGFSGTKDISNNILNNATNPLATPNGQTEVHTPPGFGVITKDNIQYADQIPPFDVTLTFANEYGQCSFMKIYDLELLNEASGVSVDSVVMEKQYTWVGRSVSPMYKGLYNRSNNGSIVNKDIYGNVIGENL